MIWRWVVGYKGYYKISNTGKIKSVPRCVPYGRSAVAWLEGKVLKPSTIKGGYKYIVLCKRGRVRGFGVHRLVLTAFVGPCPKGTECRHLDGDKLNNNLDNLYWGTSKENGADMIKHGRSTKGRTFKRVSRV